MSCVTSIHRREQQIVRPSALRQANTKWKENYILSHARTSEAYEPLKAPEQSDRAGDGMKEGYIYIYMCGWPPFWLLFVEEFICL